MSETPSAIPQQEPGSTVVRNILLALAGLYIVASLVFIVMAFNRIDELGKKQVAGQQEMSNKMDENSSRDRAAINALAQKMGVTRQELARKTDLLQRQEKEIASRVAAGLSSSAQIQS